MSEPTCGDSSFINRFKAAYYSPNQTIQQLPLGECARAIGNEFAEDYPHFLAKHIAAIALNSLLEAPIPDQEANYDPLKQPAIDIIAAAIKYGMPVSIWTAGDTGEYVDPTRGVYDQAHEYQRVKIDRSGLRERVGILLGRRVCGLDLSVAISPGSKEGALRSILSDGERSGIEEFFIADDLYKNEEIVHRVAVEYPELAIHFWLVKDDADAAGNVAAYRDYILPQLRHNSETGRKTGVVPDFDEVIFNAQASLARAAELMRKRLPIVSS